jgi:DNA-binding NtrC family response regulator
MPHILVVDDLVSIHEMLDAVIQPNGFTTSFATDGESALAKFKQEKFDLVLADIDMRPMDGLTMLKHIRLLDPAAVVILITAYASTDSAINALKAGAFDYIAKPFKVDELIKALRRGLEFREASLRKMQSAGDREPAPKAVGQRGVDDDLPLPFIGESAKVKRLLQQVQKVASARSPILIQGELGTGTHLVASHLHQLGGKERPFVTLDCAALHEKDLSAALLGQNGTGGTSVAEAHGGSLYLENIQSLPREIQRGLAHLLHSPDLGFRLICASTVDLETLVDEGAFSDQLFYRIAPMPLLVPPLRERPEDIPVLMRHFADSIQNPTLDSHSVEFTEDALRLLCSYRWPGNLMELQQVVGKAVSTSENRVITAAQLPLRLNQLRDWPKLSEYLAGQRRQYVATVLNACRGDRRLATEILGISEPELDL